MNREAAALGVPVYSIFRGKIGAVDRYLVQEGRLVLLEDVRDVQTKIKLVRWNRPSQPDHRARPALQSIVTTILSVLGTDEPRPYVPLERAEDETRIESLESIVQVKS